MLLRHFVLTQNELLKLDELMLRLNGSEDKTIAGVNPRLHAAFQSSLDVFLNAEGVTREVFGKNHGRYLKRGNISTTDTKSVAFLYDFLTTRFRHHLQNEFFVSRENKPERQDRDDILKLIHHLIDMRQSELEQLPNPLAAFISNSHITDFGEGIPNAAFNTYVGYRRSSRTGDIIRFVIRLDQTGLNRTFRFENRYRRSDDEWFVDGLGYFVQNTIYLVGHCTNHHDVSRGLRLMALRRDPTTERLYGLLISMDQQEPICARVLLIPAEDHRIALDKENFEALATHVLVRDRDMDYKEMIDTIRKELPKDLDSNESALFRYICNANFSVLKCNPERDTKFVDAELEFRNAYVAKEGYDLAKMRKAYAKLLKNAVDDYAAA